MSLRPSGTAGSARRPASAEQRAHGFGRVVPAADRTWRARLRGVVTAEVNAAKRLAQDLLAAEPALAEPRQPAPALDASGCALEHVALDREHLQQVPSYARDDGLVGQRHQRLGARSSGKRHEAAALAPRRALPPQEERVVAE